MKFRPCIDLREGKVVQIVGGTLQEHSNHAASNPRESKTADASGVDPMTEAIPLVNDTRGELSPIQFFQTAKTNFVSELAPAHYAKLYADAKLTGGHVIALGAGNIAAAREALGTWPEGLQYGGGVTAENAADWLDAGASHVIVTSYVFREGKIDFDRLKHLVQRIGADKLVLDLSCRKREGQHFVVTNRWQRFSTEVVSSELLDKLSRYCVEFLVHGVDVEGLQQGLDEELIILLGKITPLPMTYAGGARFLEDLDRVKELGAGCIDLTIGSALDIFGGQLSFQSVCSWQSKQTKHSA
jgi:phosphoribosylformimino-5-aminoimidazole carboxamide ribotide isomerase